MSKLGHEERANLMAHGNTLQLILRFSIPTIVGMLASALYSSIDKIFVGNIPGAEGTHGLAAITAFMPIGTILFAVAMLAGAGAGANISLNMGRGDKDAALRSIGSGTVLGASLTAITAIIIYIFLDPILRMLGASDEVLPQARDYTQIILLGSVFNTLSFSFTRYILAQGMASITMVTMIINVVIDSILSPFFIFVCGMGIAGAAWGTIIAQFTITLWGFYYLRTHKTPLTLRIRDLKPDWMLMSGILFLGSSPALLQLAMSVVQIVTNNALSFYGGDTSMSVMSVLSALSMTTMMPIFGINQGVQPIIGYNYGAKLYGRVRSLLIQSIGFATIAIVLLWGTLMIFTPLAVSLFSPDSAVIMNEAVFAIRTYLMLLPVLGMQIIGSTYFQAVGKPGWSLLLTQSRSMLIFIPAVMLLPMVFKINGVYMAGAVADGLSSILTFTVLMFEIRRLKRMDIANGAAKGNN